MGQGCGEIKRGRCDVLSAGGAYAKAVISPPEARQQGCEAASHTQAHNQKKIAVEAQMCAEGKADLMSVFGIVM